MRIWATISIAGFVLLTLAFVPASAGQPLPERKDAGISLKNIQSRLDEKKQLTGELEKKATQIGGEIDTLQSDLINTAGRVQKQEKTLTSLDRQLLSLKAKKAIYNDSLARDHQSISEMASALQKLSRVPPETLLLQPTSPVDTARGAMILEAMIPKIRERTDEYNKKINEISAIENSIEEKLQNQITAHQDLSRKRAQMKELLAKRQAIYQITIDEQKKHAADISFLIRQAKSIKDLFAKLQQQQQQQKAKTTTAAIPSSVKKLTTPPSGIRAFKGKAPVEGDVETGFGEKDALGALSEGLTFLARSGAAVTSPLAGTVRFAGPFQKYKQILIIEHAGGYHSLIAGLDRIDTVVGATLAGGEPVGMLASSTSSPRLYYELRHDGKPVNPKPELLAQGN